MKILDQYDYDKALSRLQFLTNSAFLTFAEKEEMKKLNKEITDFECYAKLN
jgi:hypothetical protein